MILQLFPVNQEVDGNDNPHKCIEEGGSDAHNSLGITIHIVRGEITQKLVKGEDLLVQEFHNAIAGKSVNPQRVQPVEEVAEQGGELGNEIGDALCQGRDNGKKEQGNCRKEDQVNEGNGNCAPVFLQKLKFGFVKKLLDFVTGNAEDKSNTPADDEGGEQIQKGFPEGEDCSEIIKGFVDRNQGGTQKEDAQIAFQFFPPHKKHLILYRCPKYTIVFVISKQKIQIFNHKKKEKRDERRMNFPIFYIMHEK